MHPGSIVSEYPGLQGVHHEQFPSEGIDGDARWPGESFFPERSNQFSALVPEDMDNACLGIGDVNVVTAVYGDADGRGQQPVIFRERSVVVAMGVEYMDLPQKGVDDVESA